MASNTINPALATPHTEQPASEWASSTLSALDPTTTSRPTDSAHEDIHSAVSTPGLDVPGAFPGGHLKQKVVSQDMQTAKEAAWNALETARGMAQTAAVTAGGYAQTAAVTAGGYAQTAAETAGGYLPPSVSAYLPTSTSPTTGKSLPTQELSQNEHPNTAGGVGTLPGPPGEIGAAVLPDERNGGKSLDQAIGESTGSSGTTKTSPISTTTNNGGVPHPPSSSVGIPETGLGKPSDTDLKTKLPSHDHESSLPLGKSHGVGALPGAADESSVAVLPDERNNATTSTSSSSGAHPPSSSVGIPETGLGNQSDSDFKSKLPSRDHESSTPLGKTAGVGALPGPAHESSVAILPEERNANVPPTPPAAADKPDMPHHPEEVKGSQVGQIHLDHSPVTNAREHPLAKDENEKLGEKSTLKKASVDTDASLPGTTHTSLSHPSVPAFTGRHTDASSVATPGHDGYPPQVPGKDRVGHSGPSRGVDSSEPDARDHELGHAKQPSTGDASSQSSAASTGGGSGKKPGFMSKLKGEVKVLSGKLGHKDEKVEEGKKLLGKN